MRNLFELGWEPFFAMQMNTDENGLIPARIIMHNKNIYRLITESGEAWGELSGKFRFDASEREDLPVVGDWVSARQADNDKYVITGILERKSRLVRIFADSNRNGAHQAQHRIIASNVDTAFIVTALNKELNLRRIERYLTMVWESGAWPVIVLNKADLVEHPDEYIEEVEAVAPGVDVFAVSAERTTGMDRFLNYLGAGKTIVLLGSSGVGKSTLINRLAGVDIQKTGDIREDDHKGRHTTTARQMFMLPGGGLVIDTPGIRGLQPGGDSSAGIADAFEDIVKIIETCRFSNCTHTSEPGCALNDAINSGRIPRDRAAGYLRLISEQVVLDKKARKEKDKRLSKLVAGVKKIHVKYKARQR